MNISSAIEIRAGLMDGDYHANYNITRADNGTIFMDPKSDHYYTFIFFHGVNGLNSDMVDGYLGGKFPKLDNGELIVDKHTRIIIP